MRSSSRSGELAPDDGRQLQRLARGPRQAVDAGEDDVLDGDRDADAVERLPQHDPAVLVPEHAFLEQRAHHLLEEEGVALRARQHARRQLGRQSVGGQRGARDPLAVALVERR